MDSHARHEIPLHAGLCYEAHLLHVCYILCTLPASSVWLWTCCITGMDDRLSLGGSETALLLVDSASAEQADGLPLSPTCTSSSASESQPAPERPPAEPSPVILAMALQNGSPCACDLPHQMSAWLRSVVCMHVLGSRAREFGCDSLFITVFTLFAGWHDL